MDMEEGHWGPLDKKPTLELMPLVAPSEVEYGMCAEEVSLAAGVLCIARYVATGEQDGQLHVWLQLNIVMWG